MKAYRGLQSYTVIRIGWQLRGWFGERNASRAPQPDGSSSVVIYLYVQDVDGVIERAVAAGARVLLTVTN